MVSEKNTDGFDTVVWQSAYLAENKGQSVELLVTCFKDGCVFIYEYIDQKETSFIRSPDVVAALRNFRELSAGLTLTLDTDFDFRTLSVSEVTS